MRSIRIHRAALLPLALAASFAGTAHAAGVVISQVYGGGGNSGAPLHNDFIELFNAGTNAESLNGWSVQYASSAGSTWNNLTLLPDVTLQPGQYFLIQEAAGTGGGDPLPTPDVIGAINMSGTAGKVALVGAATALSGACPTDATIVDFIGYGNAASCAEGTHTGDPGNTTPAAWTRTTTAPTSRSARRRRAIPQARRIRAAAWVSRCRWRTLASTKATAARPTRRSRSR